MIVSEIELVNFRNITEFKKSFNGGVYLVTGENEVGKSTIFNAIAMLLTGDRSSNLLKSGKEKGHAKIKVGEYEVELRFTEKNPRGSLSISAENGMKTDNKSFLEKVFAYRDFDAHQFVSWSNTAEGRRKQVQLVKSLLPEEAQTKLAKIDSDIKTWREERTTVNVRHQSAKIIFEDFNVSEEDVSKYSTKLEPAKLYEQKADASLHNDKRREVMDRCEIRTEAIANFEQNLKETLDPLKTEIIRIEELLKKRRHEKQEVEAQMRRENKELEEKQTAAVEWLKENPSYDLKDIIEKLDNVEFHNSKHEQVKGYLTAKESFEEVARKKKSFDTKIDKAAEEKATIMRESNMPIDGLTFTEEGIFLSGVPFAPGEISTSQEMEVSAKLMIAKNPKVKVFKISQGESLGEEKLKAIVEFANKNGYQGFIEEVSRGQSDLRVENYSIAE